MKNQVAKRKIKKGQVALNIFFIVLSLFYILPMILLVSISFEGADNGAFSLIPKEFSTVAYEYIFKNPTRIFDAYKVTIFYCVTSIALSLTVMSLFAYAISRPNFKLKNILTFLLFFTTLFGGGLVPTYMVNSSLLHLDDTIWIYILPWVINGWNVIVIKTSFQNLPSELFESARLDGASELRICFNIAIPLSTPVLASVGFLRFIDEWNNWSISQIYIRKPELVSLQYLLRQILDSIAVLEQMVNDGMAMGDQLANLEAARFAMAVVAAGPVLFVFPFFQKYFAKGMVVGSVKG